MRSVGTIRPTDTSAQVADRYFGLLVLSGWHLRLAKCRREECGRYFWLERWNRTYKRGTFCPDCTRVRSAESAISNTAHSREIAAHELYRLTAARFSGRIKRNPNWHQEKRLRAEIITYLSRQIERNETLKAVYLAGGRAGITAKWLGWAKNQQGIEKAIEEAANAKG